MVHIGWLRSHYLLASSLKQSPKSWGIFRPFGDSKTQRA